jgi:hypothetical protein
MKCKYCGSENLVKNGTMKRPSGATYQKTICRDCGRAPIFRIDNQTPKDMNKPKIGLSIDEFRQRHDLNFIVKNVLENLEGDKVYEKADIVRLCNLRAGYPGLNDVLEQNKEFEVYRGKVAGKFYWGKPDVIKELKDEVLLM